MRISVGLFAIALGIGSFLRLNPSGPLAVLIIVVAVGCWAGGMGTFFWAMKAPKNEPSPSSPRTDSAEG